jgi:hypothetical protein
MAESKALRQIADPVIVSVIGDSELAGGDGGRVGCRQETLSFHETSRMFASLPMGVRESVEKRVHTRGVPMSVQMVGLECCAALRASAASLLTASQSLGQSRRPGDT